MTALRDPECRRLLSSVLAYLDGDADAATCASIETHCRHCARCDELINGLRSSIGLCREAGQAAVPEAVRRRAHDRVQQLLNALNS